MIDKFLSPTKLKNFLSCKYIIYNEAYKDELNIKKKEKSKTDLLRFKKGNEHEDNYFKKLKKKFKNTTDLKKDSKDFKGRFQDTLKAMKDGFEVIRGGVLKSGNWFGETDFLIKIDGKSKFGNYAYIVHETKNTNKTKPDHVVQAGVYSSMLEEIQEYKPDVFAIVLKEFLVDEIKYDSVRNYVNFTKEKYQNFLEKGLDEARPDKCQYCNICDWIDVCKNIWKEEDNLNQICNIHKSQVKKLKDEGIDTIEKISSKKENFIVKDLNPDVFRRLNISAKLKKEAEKTGKPQFKLNEDYLNVKKGFNMLPEPQEGDLFFDIESVQDHVHTDGLEYLFGIYYVEKGNAKFKALWAHTFEEEKKNLINFFKFTENHFEKYPNAKIYHYAKYEITALRKLVAKHNICGDLNDKYLRTLKFVDLFAIVKNAIFISEDSYSIKNLEPLYNFKREGDLRKGDISQDYYAEWKETGVQSLLDDIEFYNKQDCHSTYELREWLIKIRPENCTWFEPYLKDSDYEKKDFELRNERYIKDIQSKKFKFPKIAQTVSDIVGFFRRDLRPEYRLYFERKDKTHEELVEDTEAIGNMTLLKIDEPDREKKERAHTYTYEFPDQEFKIGKGQGVENPNALVGERDSAGKVHDIDYKKRILILKRQRTKNDNHLPKILSIVPQSPPGIFDLEKANERYFDSLFQDGESIYSAIDDILNKSFPRIKGKKAGDKIINSNDFSKEIPNVLKSLDKSYMFIQGPPGTGKTTQASSAIVELIKEKKTVGVVANSHKVINNLISKVEALALKQNVSFEGFRRGSQFKEDSIFDGKLIKTYFKDDLLQTCLDSEKCQLFAGTKYHFAKVDYDKRQLDYMFVDEAGQLTTADIIAVGTSAKNIVLIGDQMQLPQPSSADHPGESGKSVLEYLLEGNDTVSPNRGIFLNKSYRMHPKINNFISNNFYEGRLDCDDQTSKRSLKIKSKYKLKVPDLNYIQADHQDYSQRNEYEGDIIKKLYKDLIGSDFKDHHGKVHKITTDDILTISPYNIQVNYLKSILPKDSRVGTIDKFQGQEAPITIISMATSDGENIPRGLDFLFNRNRLNVAISRSQLMSIIIFSPDLLLANAKGVDDIYLIENFFKLMDYKI